MRRTRFESYLDLKFDRKSIRPCFDVTGDLSYTQSITDTNGQAVRVLIPVQACIRTEL